MANTRQMTFVYRVPEGEWPGVQRTYQSLACVSTQYGAVPGMVLLYITVDVEPTTGRVEIEDWPWKTNVNDIVMSPYYYETVDNTLEEDFFAEVQDCIMRMTSEFAERNKLSEEDVYDRLFLWLQEN